MMARNYIWHVLFFIEADRQNHIEFSRQFLKCRTACFPGVPWRMRRIRAFLLAEVGRLKELLQKNDIGAATRRFAVRDSALAIFYPRRFQSISSGWPRQSPLILFSSQGHLLGLCSGRYRPQK
jgi:hypothetical protein